MTATDYYQHRRDSKGEDYKVVDVPGFTTECYKLNPKIVHIQNLTLHTLRQSWLILVESLNYDFSKYLADGKLFPDINIMKKYIKYSCLVYVSSYSVGTIVCELVRLDSAVQNGAKIAQNKAQSQKNKVEKYCVVINATAILPKYRGIGLSSKLLDHTLERIKEAKISNVYAVVDNEDGMMQQFYSKHGFSKFDTDPGFVPNSILLMKKDRQCCFSLMRLLSDGIKKLN